MPLVVGLGMALSPASRRHLLAQLERASRPLFFATLPPRAQEPTNDERRAFDEAVRALGADNTLVLPAGEELKILRPKNLPRVVAGKGARRRGVRDRVPPLRVLQAA